MSASEENDSSKQKEETVAATIIASNNNNDTPVDDKVTTLTMEIAENSEKNCSSDSNSASNVSAVNSEGGNSVPEVPKTPSKPSGIKAPAPSRIGRPCCAGTQQKPAVPTTPTKNDATKSVRKITDIFGRYKLADVQEADDETEQDNRGNSLNSTKRNRYHSTGSTSSMDALWDLYPRRLSEAGVSRHSDAVLTEDTDSFIIGQRVWVNGSKPGSIAFIGETQFAPGEWAGIVLDLPIGKNDGSVGGIRYFQCEAKKGVFARLTRLTRVPLEEYDCGSGDSYTVSPTINNGARRSPLSPTGSTRSLLKSPVSISTSNTSLSSIPHIDYKIGDRVIIKSSQGSKVGTLRYLGTTEFASGEWCGVELDEPRGKNDGSVEGIRYFECRPNFGLFAPVMKVSKSPSKHKPGACAIHSGGAGLPPTGILKRHGSKESMTSMTSYASGASSARRVRLGVTSLTNQKIGVKSTASPALATRPALQDVLREKQNQIDQLLRERHLERAEITKAASQADDAEQKLSTLRQEYEQYRTQCEEKFKEYSSKLTHLKTDQTELLSQLEEEKHKNEDLQFRFEEETITKGDIEVTNESNLKRIEELEDKLRLEIANSQNLKAENDKIIISLQQQLSEAEVAKEENSKQIKSLEEHIISVKTEHEQAKREIVDYNSKLKETSDICVTKDEEIEKLKVELHQKLKAENDKLITSLQQQLSEAEAAKEENNKQISALEEHIMSVKSEHELAKREIVDYKSKLKDTSDMCVSKDEEIEKLKAELHQNLKAENDKLITSLQQQLSEAEAAKEENSKQINLLEEQIISIKTEHEQAKKEIVDYKSKLKETSDICVSKDEEIDKLKVGIHQNLKAENDKLIKSLQQQLSEAEVAKEENSKKIKSLEEHIISVTTERELAEREIVDYKSKLKETSDICVSKDEEIEKFKAELRQNLEAKNDELITSLQQQLSEAEAAKEENSKQIKSLEEHIISVKTEHEQAKKDIVDYNSKLKETSDICLYKDEEIEKLKAELHQTKASLLETSESLNKAIIRNKELENATEEVVRLKREFSVKVNDLDNYIDIISEKDKEIELLKNEIRMVRLELEKKNTDLECYHSNYNETEKSLREDLTKAQNMIQDKTIEIETLNKEHVLQLSEKDMKLNEALAAVKSNAVEIELLRTKNADLKKTFEETSSDLHARQSRQIESRELQLTTLNSELQIYKEKVLDLENTIESLRGTLLIRDDEMKTLIIQIDQLQNDLNKASQTCAIKIASDQQAADNLVSYVHAKKYNTHLQHALSNPVPISIPSSDQRSRILIKYLRIPLIIVKKPPEIIPFKIKIKRILKIIPMPQQVILKKVIVPFTHYTTFISPKIIVKKVAVTLPSNILFTPKPVSVPIVYPFAATKIVVKKIRRTLVLSPSKILIQQVPVLNSTPPRVIIQKVFLPLIHGTTCPTSEVKVKRQCMGLPVNIMTEQVPIPIPISPPSLIQCPPPKVIVKRVAFVISRPPRVIMAKVPLPSSCCSTCNSPKVIVKKVTVPCKYSLQRVPVLVPIVHTRPVTKIIVKRILIMTPPKILFEQVPVFNSARPRVIIQKVFVPLHHCTTCPTPEIQVKKECMGLPIKILIKQVPKLIPISLPNLIQPPPPTVIVKRVPFVISRPSRVIIVKVPVTGGHSFPCISPKVVRKVLVIISSKDSNKQVPILVPITKVIVKRILVMSPPKILIQQVPVVRSTPSRVIIQKVFVPLLRGTACSTPKRKVCMGLPIKIMIKQVPKLIHISLPSLIQPPPPKIIIRPVPVLIYRTPRFIISKVPVLSALCLKCNFPKVIVKKVLVTVPSKYSIKRVPIMVPVVYTKPVTKVIVKKILVMSPPKLLFVQVPVFNSPRPRVIIQKVFVPLVYGTCQTPGVKVQKVFVRLPVKILIKQVPVPVPISLLSSIQCPPPKVIVKRLPFVISRPPRVIIVKLPVTAAHSSTCIFPKVVTKVVISVPSKYSIKRVPVFVPVVYSRPVTKVIVRKILVMSPPKILIQQIPIFNSTPRPPRVIIAKVPVPTANCLACNFPKVIVRKIIVPLKVSVKRVPILVPVTKLIVKRIMVMSPPKILIKQVPISNSKPPRVIIQKVFVPLLHGTTCPTPEITVKKECMGLPIKIMIKQVPKLIPISLPSLIQPPPPTVIVKRVPFVISRPLTCISPKVDRKVVIIVPSKHSIKRIPILVPVVYSRPVTKVIVRKILVMSPPKILIQQVPIFKLIPPRVIIQKVLVPLLHGSPCPDPEVNRTKLFLSLPVKILIKRLPVLVPIQTVIVKRVPFIISRPPRIIIAKVPVPHAHSSTSMSPNVVVKKVIVAVPSKYSIKRVHILVPVIYIKPVTKVIVKRILAMSPPKILIQQVPILKSIPPRVIIQKVFVPLLHGSTCPDPEVNRIKLFLSLPVKILIKRLPILVPIQTVIVKRVPFVISRPPRIIIAKVPVSSSLCLTCNFPKVIVKKVLVTVPSKYSIKRVPILVPVIYTKPVTKVIVKRILAMSPPKILIQQVPIFKYIPPRVIIQKVFVPLVHGTTCPTPEVKVTKVCMGLPVKIIIKQIPKLIPISLPNLIRPTRPTVIVKHIPFVISRPPRVIIAKVPVPTAYCLTCNSPKVIVRKVIVPFKVSVKQVPILVPVTKFIVKRIMVMSPPKILIEQVPVFNSKPPRVIIQKVFVPLLHGTSCPTPEVKVKKLFVRLPGRILIKQVPIPITLSISSLIKPSAPKIIIKRVPFVISRPPQIIIAKVPVPNIHCLKRLSPKVVVKVLVTLPCKYSLQRVPVLVPIVHTRPVTKVIVKRVLMTPPPKILIQQVPVSNCKPPRIIIKRVFVPLLHGTTCPIPEIKMKKVFVALPVKIIIKHVPLLVPISLPSISQLSPLTVIVKRFVISRPPWTIIVNVPVFSAHSLKSICPKVVVQKVILTVPSKYSIKRIPIFIPGVYTRPVTKVIVKKILIMSPPKILIQQVPVSNSAPPRVITQKVFVPLLYGSTCPTPEIKVKTIFVHVPIPIPSSHPSSIKPLPVTVIVKRVPIVISRPSRVIIAKIYVPSAHCLACNSPRIIFRKVPVIIPLKMSVKPVPIFVPLVYSRPVTKVFVRRVLVKSPPKILILQVPVEHSTPSRVIIQKVFVPFPHNAACSSQKVIVKKVFVVRPAKIVIKKIPILMCQSVPNLVQPPRIVTKHIEILPKILLKYIPNIIIKVVIKRLPILVSPPANALCLSKHPRIVIKYLRIPQIIFRDCYKFKQYPHVKPLPAVPLPMLHVIRMVNPLFGVNPSLPGIAISDSFVQSMIHSFSHTQEELKQCMNAVLLQRLMYEQSQTGNDGNYQQLVEEKMFAESQVNFLNSIIADMQKKNQEQQSRIEILEQGYSPNPTNEINHLLGISIRKVIPPRMYCDICQEFDLHETEDCPKQSNDDIPQVLLRKEVIKKPAERPYCENCGVFGHTTEDCKDDQTF